MAAIDLGIATSVLATFLGSDPIVVGGTPEQQARWLGRIAAEGVLVAYGATEPEAGSDLGGAEDRRRAGDRRDGTVTAYRITGKKQWISNGGVADFYTILANAPGGPTWFVVDRDTPGFAPGKPENKHGIRLSNTAALFLDEVEVPADRLVGGVEGQGLVQAQLVFGYTRLMVAAFGLGAGWAALDRAIPYSAERIQGGGPLSEKQGYTHKLIVPHAVRLEAARAYIEETAERLDEVHIGLNTEGAIAKYLATEAGNAAADAAIQALGGYGYTHEYLVEKIKRDVRITTIYEGTSEIMEMTIARDRWQQHLKTTGRHYHDAAADARGAPSHPPLRRCRRRRPRPSRPGRGVRVGAGRPPDPQPARAVPPGRAGGAHRGLRPPSPAGRRGPPTARWRRRRATGSAPTALAAMARVFAREAALEDGHRRDALGARRGRRRGRRRQAGGGGRRGGGVPSSGRVVGRSRRGGRRAVRPPDDRSAVMSIEPITAVAVVGVGAILPDAPDAATFWANVRGGRYSITDVEPERWDPAFYYDANPKAPDKTYSKIGGWVRDWTWDPLGWKLPIPPRVGDAMDDAQKWAVACTRAALLDYGWPERPIDGERTAVVLGNAMSGERHYLTALRIAFPELAHELDRAPTFQALPADVRKAISAEFGELLGRPLSRDHRGHDARRARQLHGRPGGQPVRPARPQLRGRRRLRVGPRRHRRVRRRSRRPLLRHRHRRRRRPQHGRVELRQVLQDRRALGHRHPAVRRRRRRVRHG